MLHAGAIDGAIMGGIAGALVSFVFILIGRSNQKKGKALGKPTVQEFWWHGPYDQGFERALQILSLLKVKVLNTDRHAGIILGGTPINMRSFGVTLHVRFFQEQSAIRVRIDAAPSGSPSDRGFSRNLVEQFVQNWNSLPAPGSPPLPPGDFVV